MKDMFYYDGLPSRLNFKSCADCPFVKIKNNNWICKETESDVSAYARHGKHNFQCPFGIKDIG